MPVGVVDVLEVVDVEQQQAQWLLVASRIGVSEGQLFV